MYAGKMIIVCLLSLCIGITCQAATFVKVSSSFSMTRDVHLDCSGADPGDRDWYLSQKVDDDPDGYSSWGHTPILKKGTAFLVGLNNRETAATDMSCGNPGGDGNAASVPMDAGDPTCYRVRTSVLQGPILEVWQPGYGYSYSVTMAVATNAVAYYKIEAQSGENAGDEVTLLVEGWVDDHENSSGPAGSAIIQYIGPAGTTGYSNIAGTPGYVNLADGIWHNLSDTRYFTARIGDTIGMRTSAASAMDYSGPIKSWVANSYMPRSLYALSSISADIVPKPLPGDIDGDRIINIGDAILALQALSGLNTDMIRYDYAVAGIDINGDNKAGLAEVINIMQTVAGLRQQ